MRALIVLPRCFSLLALCALLTGLLGCPRAGETADRSRGIDTSAPLVRSVNLNDPVRPIPQEGAITIAAAKNEWTSFAIQLDRLPRPNAKRPHSLRLRSLRKDNESIPVDQYNTFQVIELPVDVNRAGYVRHTGLSVEQIVELHSAPLYPVYALGSHPGYCYLGGMDPRIATPRRKVPVLSIPGGAVSIGGSQTGVSASAGPSGWNTIGSSPLAFFYPDREVPVLLQHGDSIRFRVERIIR